MSSSEDDDIPLSSLGKGGKRSRIKDDESSEAEFDDEASDEPADEEDIDDFVVEDEEGDDDEDVDYDSDDSDDDIPISALKSPTTKKKAAKKPAAKSKATKAKAAPKKKATTAKKKKPATTKKAASKSAAGASSSYVSASTELYANSDKGTLIQSLLARWWYVYTWPDPATMTSTPKGYDALDGFPGVYICTSGENVGKFKDDRDPKTAPTFQNLSKKTSAELRDDLLQAIEKQMAALIKAEGGGTKTEKDLKALQKWATKLNCSKADKDAAKVLKAAKLTV